eukprot:Clim_evm33s242 gene=Clim_evmTU33s242
MLQKSALRAFRGYGPTTTRRTLSRLRLVVPAFPHFNQAAWKSTAVFSNDRLRGENIRGNAWGGAPWIDRTAKKDTPAEEGPPKKLPNDWKPPMGRDMGIKVYNSLTKCKVPFIIPTDGPVKWYQCGPTVYDQAHLGHASCYVRFDIIRRLLVDFFRLDVFLVLGMTDVDDKIIARAEEFNVHSHTLARYFEIEFMRDMQKLNVRPPNAITRVTEHVPEIADFVKQLLDKKKAYRNDIGDVYFDVGAHGPNYGRLRPDRQKDFQAKQQQQEKNIASNPSIAEDEATEIQDEVGNQKWKKDPRDFAMWKHARDGEPSWEVEALGAGRPGWHVECSAMSSRFFGKHMLLHTGGADLAFPHHDNEIAQCEAFHDCDQWVDYFMHAGHLNIQGLKMSKSLKNFTTVKQFLREYSGTQFRIFCLQSKYSSVIEFNEKSMAEATTIEKKFTDYFNNLAIRMRKGEEMKRPSRTWGNDEYDLNLKLQNARQRVVDAIKDDFDTPTALQILVDLVNETNVYLSKPSQDLEAPEQPPRELLFNLSYFVDNTLRHFGVELTVKREAGVSTITTTEPILDKLLDRMVDFRSAVRNLGIERLRESKRHGKRNKKAAAAAAAAAVTSEDRQEGPDVSGSKDGTADPTDILRYCDELRDRHLVDIGVEIKDYKDFSSWAIFDKRSFTGGRPNQYAATLSSARAASTAEGSESPFEAVRHPPMRGASGKASADEVKVPQSVAKPVAVDADGIVEVSPQEAYEQRETLFSEFDDKGYPTHDRDGKQLSKNRKKKIMKVFDKQKRRSA